MDNLKYFESFSLSEWIIFSLISNIVLFLISICLYKIINKNNSNKIQFNNHAINKVDIYISIITIFINSLIMILAYILWKEEIIYILKPLIWYETIIEIISIVIIMDLLMYVFHFIAHKPPFYEIIHKIHHNHINTNYLSLFTLHPLESFGFGLLMILIFSIFNFSINSIIVYVFINLIWGTLGHINNDIFPKWSKKIFIGTTKFHLNHHENEKSNFGFYTTIWDHLFKTIKK